jgi:hypothetical protein
MNKEQTTKKQSWIVGMIECLAGKIRLRKEAKRHGFPIRINGRYMYVCYCWMGFKALQRWQDFMKDQGIEGRYLFPLRGNGDIVATYRLIRLYQKGSRGSDLAYGDSGTHGDFKLERIDCLPNS